MEFNEFVRQIIKDLKWEFNYSEVRMDGKDRLYVERGPTNVSIPLHPWHQECLAYGYQESFQNYKKMINDVLNLYQFKLNPGNVYPFIKHESFGISDEFIREDIFCDLKMYWVSDMEEAFRFVSMEDMKDAGIDMDTLKAKSFENLNKIVIPLVRLDETIGIYTFPFVTDYAATLFLSENIQKQIQRKIGDDILFCMPSSSCLLCAQYHPSTYRAYIQILEHLISIDIDANTISDRVYRRDGNGEYSIIA